MSTRDSGVTMLVPRSHTLKVHFTPPCSPCPETVPRSICKISERDEEQRLDFQEQRWNFQERWLRM